MVYFTWNYNCFWDTKKRFKFFSSDWLSIRGINMRIRGFEVIEEFKDKHSGNVSLIRCEMQERYKVGRDRDVIAKVFHNSIKSDQIWIVKQEKQGNK
jgi:hypothetical protein